MIEQSPVILFGGGLDSGAMVEYAIRSKKTPVLFHIDYGAKARMGEYRALLYFATKHALQHRVMQLPLFLYERSPLHAGEMVSDHRKNYLPGRNLLFLTLAASFASGIGSQEVWTGFHTEPEGSVFEDAKAKFLRSLDLLMLETYPGFPKLVAPFIMLEREEYLREALATEPLLFARTFSCYESTTITECGKCTHCQMKVKLADEIRGRA